MPKESNNESTYLKQLKFDPKLALGLIAAYYSNLRLVLLLVFAIVILGIFSYLNLPRTVNPEIKIPMVIISTVLPGAGPKDVESLVTIPLEDSVKSLQKVKTVQSSSRDSVSIISIEFQSGVDPDKAQSDVKSAVDSVTDLPSDAQTPKVQKLDFENQPVWTFDLVGSDDASLFRFARSLKESIESLPGVDRVEISGQDEQEVQIVIKPEAVSSHKINPLQISQLIKVSLKALPAGSVKTTTSSFSLSIDPAVISVEDIRNLRINFGDAPVALSDIANISLRSKPDQRSSFVATSNSQPSKAVTFDVFKSGTARIDTTVDAVKKDVDSQIQKTSGQFQVLSVRDVGESIEKQFHDLQRDFILTISLVTLILFIFLGVRQAFVSALAAPLTFFITFVVMNLTGISLSFISIFSLLLSLGLLVDDTIVVVSAMTAYYRSGKFTPLQTGLLVFRDFLAPVLTTTVTTVWAFLPLLLASGIIGEFIKPIPIVVSATLIASIFVALFITLPIIIFLLKPELPLRVIIFLRLILLVIILAVFYTFIPKTNILLLEILAFLIFLFVTFQIRTYLDGRTFNSITRSKRTASFIRKFRSYLDQGIISFQKLSSTYKKVITRILRSSSARKKAILMVIIFSIFSYLLLPLGFIQSEFFPKTNADFLFVSIELPAGTNLSITNQEAKRLLEEIKKTPDVKFVTADVGKSFSNTQGISQGDTNTILLSLELFKEGSRQRTSFEIADILRQKFASYQKGKISVQELSSGPPAGADLQIKLFGPDLKVLDQYANRIEDYLSKQPGVTNVDKTIKPGTSKLVFIPNKQKLSEIGLTQDQIGFWLRLYASGFTADKIKLDNDNNQKKDINIRLNSQPETVENISEIYLPTPAGILPITSLGDIKLEPNPTLITRENGKRTISVTASVLKGYQPTALNKSLEEFANSLNLPSDYSWQTGGLNEENQNSVNSILQAMALSFLLIIVTMVLQFGSFRKALIVMLVIPLSVSGVFIIFALTQTPLSFPALIGVLALFGIVVKNSILLVDKIIANIHTGMEFTEAISDAAASRLEAISLTSLATIFGLIPITFSSPLWRGLGGAIIAGLTFSGTIMLFFIPVVYYLIFKGSEGVKSAKKAKS